MRDSDLAIQIEALLMQYPNLRVSKNGNDTIIEGCFVLDVEVKDVPLYETYDIRVLISPEYPDILPTLFELSHKIPSAF
ncbi:MAG: hypothetical protein AAGU74_11815 [Bacillota bacterium]